MMITYTTPLWKHTDKANYSVLLGESNRDALLLEITGYMLWGTVTISQRAEERLLKVLLKRKERLEENDDY